MPWWAWILTVIGVANAALLVSLIRGARQPAAGDGLLRKVAEQAKERPPWTR